MTAKSILRLGRFRLVSAIRVSCVLPLLALVLVSATVRADVDSATLEDHLGFLHWRDVGPMRGGRTMTVVGHPDKPLVFYTGSTGGGVWKTENAGISWFNISDNYFTSSSVGSIAIAPSSPETVYVGMGESGFRGDSAEGDGVYKTLDGGKTWTHIGLEQTLQISRVRIHPTDPNTVYVAALGNCWGPSAERGVFRTKDGGKTWKKILYRDENTGAADLAMDPTNPDILYASLLELRRFPWGFRSAGPGSGMFKSTDGGDTWKEITNNPGLPDGLKGRIGIAIAPKMTNRVWAIIDAATGKKGMFRSDDSGATWKKISDFADIMQRPWYYSYLTPDPIDPNVVYSMNVWFWKSSDGGVTWDEVKGLPHGDYHDFWIDPKNTDRMINGSDGGATVSLDGGKSWSSIWNQPTAQIYHVETDNATPYRVYGAQQDNTTMSLPSRSDHGAITLQDWEVVGGGEAGYIAPSLVDPTIIYAADHHWLTRYDRKSGQVRDISPDPETNYGWGSADLKFRFWWTYPVHVSPSSHGKDTLYVTSQYVMRSINQGQSWDIISPDLTRHDPDTLEKTPDFRNPGTGKYWGPITREAYGPEWYATIFAFEESPIKAGLLWAGSDDGYIHVSQDDGKNWKQVNIPGLPDFALISIICPSPNDPATAYVAATRYKLQDNKPYFYKTHNYGETWEKITTGIPEGAFSRSIREMPGKQGLLFAGTEQGVYVSLNDGARWDSLRINLPLSVPAHDLQAKNADLVGAFHGRGFWILDNASLIKQFDDESLKAPIKLFQPPDTIAYISRFSLIGPGTGPGMTGANPHDGVMIPVYFKDAPTQPVDFAFSRQLGDGTWEPVNKLRFDPAATDHSSLMLQRGANVFYWDRRYPGPEKLADVFIQAPPSGQTIKGPMGPPGVYRVEMKVGDLAQSKEFIVIKDPRVTYTDEDLVAQYKFLKEVQDKFTETMKLVTELRDVRKQAAAAMQNANLSPGRKAEAEKALKDIDDKLAIVEERLIQPKARAFEDFQNFPVGIDSKLSRLGNFSSMGDGPPTQGAKDLYDQLDKAVDARKKTVDQIKEEDLPKLMHLISG
jgi:photosystem II stability/assembly factor-like uncharacterized protein